MDQFKIDNFKKEMGDKEFPWFETLSDEERNKIVSNISRQVMPKKSKGLSDLVERIRGIQTSIKGVNVKVGELNIDDIFKSKNIDPKDEIFIGWNGYKIIDKIGWKDFAGYFEFIWYSGQDDIDLFDRSYKWIMTIDHDGNIKYLLL